jgi:FAD/FMN-containing dehydrogenase
MAAQQATGVALEAEPVQGIAARVRGAVLVPGDPGYEEARALWNGLIDRWPALIVRCLGAADVIAAVNFAREHDLLLSVKGDGGLVIDLSLMRGVHVDPAARTARVQGGATWGDLDAETQLYGLAVPGGVVSTTGIAGLTLHGGEQAEGGASECGGASVATAVCSAVSMKP